MWARNALFVIVCLAGTALVSNSLLRRGRVARPASFDASRVTVASARPDNEWRRSLDRLNGEFQDDWKAKGLDSAPPADDLTLARRLSLALVGTVPSLEEIRALEAVPQVDRLEWWTSH
jgi:Protein of unknown function (DUF1549)